MTDFLIGFLIGLGSFCIGAAIGYQLLKIKKVEKFLSCHLDPILHTLGL